MKKILSLFLFLIFSQLVTVNAAEKSLFDTSNTSFSNDDEFLKVEQAFVFDFYQKDNQVELTFNIKEGYYLYRHQFKFSAKNAQFTPVELPVGIDHEDEFFGIQQIYHSSLSLLVELTEVNPDAVLTVRYQGCAEKGLCYPPVSQKIPLKALKKIANNSNIINTLNDNSSSKNEITEEPTSSQSAQFTILEQLKNNSLWVILPALFALGLGLAFTPCVFPMYPILTGIIVGQGENLSNARAFKLSFFYVQGMAFTYTILGVVVALAGAQFQAMFQHPAVLIFLSVLFVFLALSMFGVFNLALPSSWQNKLNNLSNQQQGGSYTGVISMGAISGLVASPCTTAPLTGVLIYISQTGDIVIGASALYALSLGMGLPLLVLGSSGGKLLPKAGGWMNIIKNIFGLLLLAVPIFLLERFIPGEASQALWAIWLLACATYFYVVNQASAKTFFYGLRSLIIFLMLFFGAQLLSKVIFTTTTSHAQATVEHAKFVKVASLAELNTAIKEANQQGKTVMVDMYADWCIACKEFEEYTFPDQAVVNTLQNTLLIQIDLTDPSSPNSAEIMEKFEIFGLPSILFFDLSGNELNNKRVTGFMDAKEFNAHLKTFL